MVATALAIKAIEEKRDMTIQELREFELLWKSKGIQKGLEQLTVHRAANEICGQMPGNARRYEAVKSFEQHLHFALNCPHCSKLIIITIAREQLNKINIGQAVLHYYPCRMTINGSLVESIWERARVKNAKVFKSGACHGFFMPDPWGSRITLLCKYERLTELEIASLGKGGHGMHYDLRDYYESGFCVFRGIRAVLNCNSLSVTISRDSFYLDWNYQAMKTILSNELLSHFGSEEHHWNDSELVLANQYVFRKRLKAILAGEQAAAGGGGETNETESLKDWLRLRPIV